MIGGPLLSKTWGSPMVRQPPCPLCKSTHVNRTKYVGGVIIWFICRQCAHVFCETPFKGVSPLPSASAMSRGVRNPAAWRVPFSLSGASSGQPSKLVLAAHVRRPEGGSFGSVEYSVGVPFRVGITPDLSLRPARLLTLRTPPAFHPSTPARRAPVVSKNPIEASKVPVWVWVGVARDTHGRPDDEQFRISD
jgi:hypothetical protein